MKVTKKVTTQNVGNALAFMGLVALPLFMALILYQERQRPK